MQHSLKHTMIAALLVGMTGVAAADPTVTKVADAQASTTLDSVLEHVVIAKPALDASRGSASAKGSLEVIKADGGKPTVRGTLVVGTDGQPGFHKRTIDWNFTTNVGEFRSVRRDATETSSVEVTGKPGAVHQVRASKGGPIERQEIIDSKTVTLKAGGTAEIVTTDDKLSITSATAVVHFQSSGEPALLQKGGYVKSELAGGGQQYARHAVTVGGQKVTDQELAGFLKGRVVAP